MQRPFEDLRRDVRQVENEIDVKLVSLSKLGTSIQNAGAWSNGDPLSSHSSSTTCEAMALEIEQLINKLTSLNDQLAESAGNVSQVSSNSAAVERAVARHTGILQGYTLEFDKIKSRIHIEQERADLLGSVRRDIAAHKSSGVDRQTALYMGEHERLLSSDRVADEALGVAVRARQSLEAQRRRLLNITGSVRNLLNRFPAINSLVGRINVRKRRDSIILGSVIAVCIIVLFLFM
ncbi:Golgi SNAP receptor complex member 1-like [Sycon ciliatum]|uniref:Golgi SNAP receptor complex member 1-like n=1 Tax=Sycon ciliatum TaxID=27933 RepID=UPI0020ADF967|eukprot:scpid94239/ scgid13939/ Golgi SNAP receptor complex member 1; 28 kDa Golgi SNARE protein; 28 kDa cis-Golgi SNARE p28